MYFVWADGQGINVTLFAKIEKNYPLIYQEKDILKDTHYVVDMSTIKNDGG